MTSDAASNNEHLIPEIDRDFLNEKGLIFSVIPEAGALHLVIKDFPFPAAYSPTVGDLLIILPAGYPSAQLDMFWTKPDVKLVNGSWPAAADQHATYRNENWQRWSRHYSADTPWRSGIDGLRSFLSVMKKDLEKGI